MNERSGEAFEFDIRLTVVGDKLKPGQRAPDFALDYLAPGGSNIQTVKLSDSHGKVRLLNVLPMTPVMLAEYVPADFDEQQRQTSEEALAIVARESGIDQGRISTIVRQGGIYHEILEEAAAVKADLIVMTSHRPAMRTYFLGSNAGHVVRYAKCSVLVVRH